jgi:hypothetical protein
VAQNHVRLAKEQAEINQRRLAADLSKTITKLMATTNSWADGTYRMRKLRPRSENNENNQRRLNDLGSRQDCDNDRRKKRRGRGLEAAGDTNTVTAGQIDWCDSQRNDQSDDNRGGSGSSRSN